MTPASFQIASASTSWTPDGLPLVSAECVPDALAARSRRRAAPAEHGVERGPGPDLHRLPGLRVLAADPALRGPAPSAQAAGKLGDRHPPGRARGRARAHEGSWARHARAA